jgi:cystathionine beta-lyase/cystathionine gamma-synthase
VAEPDGSSPATLVAHDPDIAGGPMAPPIQQTSLFTFRNVAEMQATFAGQRAQPLYSRVGNPTVRLFEDKVAALEGGEAARAFASGMAAISSAILAHVAAGERIVCVRNVYPDTYRLLRKLLPRLGIEARFVDGRDLEALDAALEGARLLYLESPTSLVFDVHDLAAQAALARDHGVTTICDNSWATPIHQRPLAQGVDMVVHSASKYLSGHSDTVAGIVVGSKASGSRTPTCSRIRKPRPSSSGWMSC